MIDYDSAMPPYQQVASILRRRIERGEIPPGGRVPSVPSLMHEFGIARNTARHALAVLAEEGLVEIIKGWGTFVKGTPGPQG